MDSGIRGGPGTRPVDTRDDCSYIFGESKGIGGFVTVGVSTGVIQGFPVISFFCSCIRFTCGLKVAILRKGPWASYAQSVVGTYTQNKNTSKHKVALVQNPAAP